MPYSFTPDMREISGFGGGYEQTCRNMLIAAVEWLDAHPDFNDPETTQSGFLGGMCLAAACGAWDAGLGAIWATD